MKFNNISLCAVLLLSFFLAGCAANRDLTLVRDEAYLAYQDGDYPTAVTRFEILVQEIPADAELWFRLGNSYARSMRPKQAIEAYENALLRDPQLSKAWYNMGLIHMQAALKSFIDMQDYVREDDPVAQKGKTMSDGLFPLLDQDGEGDKQD